jgi:hypothetical protein
MKDNSKRRSLLDIWKLAFVGRPRPAIINRHF